MPLHIVCPGPQTPVHAPETHVAFALHSTAVPHAPLSPHVCTPLPLHCAVPGVHATHAPFRHAGVVPLHGVDGVQPSCTPQPAQPPSDDPDEDSDDEELEEPLDDAQPPRVLAASPHPSASRRTFCSVTPIRHIPRSAKLAPFGVDRTPPSGKSASPYGGHGLVRNVGEGQLVFDAYGRLLAPNHDKRSEHEPPIG